MYIQIRCCLQENRDQVGLFSTSWKKPKKTSGKMFVLPLCQTIELRGKQDEGGHRDRARLVGLNCDCGLVNVENVIGF